MRHALLFAACLLGTSLHAEIPRIKTVYPTPLNPGSTVTITAEYVPADAKRPVMLLRTVGTSVLSIPPAEVVPGGVIGILRQYHARVPTDTPDGEYRVYLHYEGLATPGLTAPTLVRVLTPSCVARYAWVAGILAVLVGVVTALAVTKQRLGKLWRGADGKSSTSKFQFVLWSVVVLFAFTTIAALYLANGKMIDTDAPCSLPQNIWIVLGLSGVTAIAAKGITVSQINAGRRTPRPTSEGGLLTSDDGGPELFKVQLLTWTYVAITIYLSQFISALTDLTADKLTSAPGCHIPDIDTTLMILMGLSQGTYLGKKLVTADTPRIASIAPNGGVVGLTITITGTAFGETQVGSAITIDDQPISVNATWADSQVSFAMPQTINGVPIEPGPHTIALLVNGRLSAGSAIFTLAPNLTSVTPAAVAIKPATMPDLTLIGETFGVAKGEVCFDNVPIPESHILTWTHDQIRVKLAPKHPNSQDWTQGIVRVTVIANGSQSGSKSVTFQ